MIDAAEQGDAEAWVQADTSFHEVILRAADNPTVADIARVTRRRIQRFWNRSLETSTRLTTCSQEHREIAGAVARGERDEVEAAVTDHINHMRSSVETILQVAGSVLGATPR
jgi:DNA-binding GntR family transcriptional regulator